MRNYRRKALPGVSFLRTLLPRLPDCASCGGGSRFCPHALPPFPFRPGAILVRSPPRWCPTLWGTSLCWGLPRPGLFLVGGAILVRSLLVGASPCGGSFCWVLPCPGLFFVRGSNLCPEPSSLVSHLVEWLPFVEFYLARELSPFGCALSSGAAELGAGGFTKRSPDRSARFRTSALGMRNGRVSLI